VAPLRDRLDELERTMLETIVRLASPSSASPSPRGDALPTPGGAATRFLALFGDRRRRVMLALGGILVLGIGTLFAMLASCS
jgi:hypothetical protein